MQQQPKLNREQRRALKKKKGRIPQSEETMKWDELKGLFDLCRQFLSTSLLIEQPLREVADYVKNVDHLNGVLSRINNDAQQLSEELLAIHKNHADKTGEASEEDIMDLFAFTQTYYTWLERAKAVMEPAYDELVDIHFVAQKAKAEAEGVDPATVQAMPKLDLAL